MKTTERYKTMVRLEEESQKRTQAREQQALTEMREEIRKGMMAAAQALVPDQLQRAIAGMALQFSNAITDQRALANLALERLERRVIVLEDRVAALTPKAKAKWGRR